MVSKKHWPVVSRRNKNLSLVVAGKGQGSWVEGYQGLNNFKFLGAVDDPSVLYKNSAACIVPIFFGSGTRVKVIEASLHGRACISTSLGAEGTQLVPGSSFICAESQEEWIDALCNFDITHAARVGDEAFGSISKSFCAVASANKFLRLIAKPLLTV